jgi:energy-coupling factor transport system permease protein
MRTVEYVDRDSLLHRLDPRVNVFISITVLLAAFLFTDPAYLAAVFGATLALVAVGKLGREFLPWLKLLLPFAVVSFFMWTLFSGLSLGATESTVIAEVGFVEITRRGLSRGISMPFRIVTMMSVPILFMMTVTNSELIKALGQLGVPYKIAFGFGLAFRLVYVFQDEIRRIREAQKSRGAVLDSGTPLQRIRRNIPVLVPAMVRGFESSKQLSTVLDLRGFDDAHRRTSAHRLEASRVDIVVAAVCLVGFVSIVALRLLGYGTP